MTTNNRPQARTTAQEALAHLAATLADPQGLADLELVARSIDTAVADTANPGTQAWANELRIDLLRAAYVFDIARFIAMVETNRASETATLSAADSAAFAKAILDPAAPNEALIAAEARYRESQQ